MNLLRSISLSSFFIITALMMNMDLCCELPKIPNLIEHYAEHKSTDGDSFWQFLMEDYIDQESGHNHHNDGEHDDLPFHGSHTCHHAPVVFDSNITYSLSPLRLYLEKGNCEYHFPFLSIYLEAPFQPPQQA